MLINDAEITGSLIVNASSSFQNIEVSGNILPGINNIHNLGSPEKYWKEIYVSTSSINFVDNGIVTASLSANTLNALLQNTSSANDSITNINSFTQSFSSSISTSLSEFSSSVSTSIGATTASILALSQSMNDTLHWPATGLIASISSSINTATSSLSASFYDSISVLTISASSAKLTNDTQDSSISNLHSYTSSLNNAIQLTGSTVSFLGNVVVYGTQSIINSTNVELADNILYLAPTSSIDNDLGIVGHYNDGTYRHAGIFMDASDGHSWKVFKGLQDETSAQINTSGTGFTLADFKAGVFTGTSFNGTINATNGVISGSSQILGGSGLVSGSSQITYASISSIPSGIVSGSLQVTTLLPTGVVSGSSQITYTSISSIPSGIVSGSSQINLTATTNYSTGIKTRLDAETVVSGSKTISGITLGSNLATLTIGTGLSGTSYNGSSAVTIANSGVTSIVAGTGISINQGTAAVTVTNTITNNNQLTNGAGYITSAGNAATAGGYAVETGRNNNASRIVTTDANGYIQCGYINSSNGNEGNNSNPSRVWGTNGSDSYLRSYLTSALSVSYASTAGNSSTTSQREYSYLRINSNEDLYLDYNYGCSIVGVYASTRYQGVFSMGNSWKLARDGTTSGNLYGLAWSHPNTGGQAGYLSTHGLLVMENGTCNTALANGIWTRGDVTAYSDARVKENVEVIENAIEKVKAIRGVTFTRTDREDKTKRFAGVIAQEVLPVLPEVVTEDAIGTYSVAYGNLAGLFIEAFKEQQKEIDELKNIINGLTK